LDGLASALVLGIVEGLTEFIPVSSTGHILLLGHFLGFESTGRAFEVMIQLGAIMAILSVYAARILQILVALPHDPGAQRLFAGVWLAFLPAVIVGVLAHDIIKTVLFETPWLIAVMLVAGGVVLLVVDRMALSPRYAEAQDLPLSRALAIGAIQCLAMVPGVSRSGATIVGALMLGASRRAAAEFSFFLSMPTMAGAFAYDLLKNRAMLDADAWLQIGVGFVAAFVAAVVVVRWLLDFVTKRGFAVFGWWRIIVGSATLTLLALGL
jgi:undecaprenyl-diphosphatase